MVFVECPSRELLEQATAMEKVAVFGNAGAGKSTLAKRLAAITGLPLYPLDTMQFRAGRYRPEEKDLRAAVNGLLGEVGLRTIEANEIKGMIGDGVLKL